MKHFIEKGTSQYVQRRRTVHDFPGVISAQRQDCVDGFFGPVLADIAAKRKEIEDYFRSETVGLLLPLGSQREYNTFPKTLTYARDLGITPERIIVVHSPESCTIINDLDLRSQGYLILNESLLLKLFDLDRIHARFAVDMANHRGKGRAFAMAFAYLKYVSSWKTLQDLFFLDVDANAPQFQPLHYLGYARVVFPDDQRLFLLTAQNNALRDNHYLFVMRECWRHESDLGRRYAAHLDQLVWSLTGEMMLRWDLLGDQIPFTLGYGLETSWQLFAADQVAFSSQESRYRVSQVVNRHTKRDGGEIGQSGRCYDATMYRQLNLMAWFLIQHGKPLSQLAVEDYHTINTRLNNARHTVILPDNDDHGPPYRVELRSDNFIPPLAMLAAENCLCIGDKKLTLAL